MGVRGGGAGGTDNPGQRGWVSISKYGFVPPQPGLTWYSGGTAWKLELFPPFEVYLVEQRRPHSGPDPTASPWGKRDSPSLSLSCPLCLTSFPGSLCESQPGKIAKVLCQGKRTITCKVLLLSSSLSKTFSRGRRVQNAGDASV